MQKPQHPEFGQALGTLVNNSGMSFREIEQETYELYGGLTIVTRQDLSAYLLGERLPRADKLAAFFDAVGATQGEIVKVLRSFPRKKPIARR